MPSAPSTFSYHSVVRCASPALPPAPSAIAGMPRAMGALASVDALVSSASWPSARLAAIARSDRKSTRLNSSHLVISYAVFCLKKKNNQPATLSHSRHSNQHLTEAVKCLSDLRHSLNHPHPVVVVRSHAPLHLCGQPADRKPIH